MAIVTNELATYTAGLFDGEGCVRYWKSPHKSTPQLEADIANSCQSTLQELRDLWGIGSVCCKTGKNLPANWSPGYSWRMQSLQAEKFLRRIQPYTRIKSDQIEVALRIRGLSRGRGVNWSCEDKEQRDKLIAELSQLKRKFRTTKEE